MYVTNEDTVDKVVNLIVHKFFFLSRRVRYFRIEIYFQSAKGVINYRELTFNQLTWKI